MMKRVLLVDDEFALVDTLRDFLEDEGYLVESATNGREALDFMATNRPDLVITDVMMPIMDARGLLRAMQQDEGLKDIPVLVISAVRKHIAMGEDGELKYAVFLRKPFQLDKLLKEVLALIGPGEGGRINPETR